VRFTHSFTTVTAPPNNPLHVVPGRHCCQIGELLASLEDTPSPGRHSPDTVCAACVGLEAAGGAGQRGCGCEAQIVRRRCWRPRITPRSEHHTMLHPLVRASRSISIRVVVRALWSSSTLLCCAAKRVRTASGCGEAAAELRACARGDVCGGSSGRVASPNSPNTASGTKYECILTRRRGGCRHVTHTNGTAYIRGTYSRVQNTHKHTQTHTNTHKVPHTTMGEHGTCRGTLVSLGSGLRSSSNVPKRAKRERPAVHVQPCFWFMAGLWDGRCGERGLVHGGEDLR